MATPGGSTKPTQPRIRTTSPRNEGVTTSIRHSLNLNALYELPFGRGRQFAGGVSRPLNLLVGDWQVGSVLNFRSGVPIDILIVRPDIAYINNGTGSVSTTPVVQNGVVLTRAVVNVPGGGASRNVRRPNIVPGVSPYTRSGLQLINPAAFSVPAPGTFGNFTRNDLTGPMLSQLDLTLRRPSRSQSRRISSFVQKDTTSSITQTLLILETLGWHRESPASNLDSPLAQLQRALSSGRIIPPCPTR